MSNRRTIRTVSVIGMLLAGLFFSTTCKESASSPTAPGAATVMGTVVSGDEMLPPQGSSLSGVTVRVVQTGQSSVTDGAGDFTLANVPSGNPEFEFSRADFNARGAIATTAGATVAVTASILRKSTVLVSLRGNAPGTPPPHGNTVEEIEGLVSAVGGSTLTIFDQRLGSVVVNVTGTTTIRKGGTSLLLSQILVGMRVHVKATIVGGNTYTAIEIIVQDENTKTATPGAHPATTTPTASATRTPTPTSTPTQTPMP